MNGAKGTLTPIPEQFAHINKIHQAKNHGQIPVLAFPGQNLPKQPTILTNQPNINKINIQRMNLIDDGNEHLFEIRLGL